MNTNRSPVVIWPSITSTPPYPSTTAIAVADSRSTTGK